jgi:hypothetical protein
MPSGVPNNPQKGDRLLAAVFVTIPARRANPAHVRAGARTFFVTSSAWGKQRQVRAHIRNNPVARNLVANPQNDPHSSAHPGFELDPVPQGLQKQAGALNIAG